MEMHWCNNDEQQRKRRLMLLSDKQDDNKQDRLSSLPDAILTEILSRVPIHSAAATSVLSRRYRNLWTAVTYFEFHDPNGDIRSTRYNILSQLTSPIIRKFTVRLDVCWGDSESEEQDQDALLCFRLVCSRKVEEIKVTSYGFRVPACVFKCQTLVSLDLDTIIECSFVEDITIGLPNLKKLRLVLRYSFQPIATLFKSCPLLEHFCLVIWYLDYQNLVDDQNVVNISAPNLKSLSIDMRSPEEQYKFIIETPNLAHLEIHDSISLYKFVPKPTQLVSALIDTSYGWEPGVDKWIDVEIHHRELAKFVEGLTSVINLHLKNTVKIFTFLDPMVNGAMPVFHNLVCFITTLNKGAWFDNVIVPLRCAPNVEVLEVNMEGKRFMDHISNWCPPNCFLTKLRTVKICGLNCYNHEISLLEFILKYAFVLKELQIIEVDNPSESEEAQVLKEYKFCKALFKLPKSSSISEVVFSGRYIKATSSGIKHGLLDCQIRFPI